MAKQQLRHVSTLNRGHMLKSFTYLGVYANASHQEANSL